MLDEASADSTRDSTKLMFTSHETKMADQIKMCIVVNEFREN